MGALRYRTTSGNDKILLVALEKVVILMKCFHAKAAFQIMLFCLRNIGQQRSLVSTAQPQIPTHAQPLQYTLYFMLHACQLLVV